MLPRQINEFSQKGNRKKLSYWPDLVVVVQGKILLDDLLAGGQGDLDGSLDDGGQILLDGLLDGDGDHLDGVRLVLDERQPGVDRHVGNDAI